jgi:hypothetical protein
VFDIDKNTLRSAAVRPAFIGILSRVGCGIIGVDLVRLGYVLSERPSTGTIASACVAVAFTTTSTITIARAGTMTVTIAAYQLIFFGRSGIGREYGTMTDIMDKNCTRGTQDAEQCDSIEKFPACCCSLLALGP